MTAPESPPVAPVKRRLQFELRHVLYAIALLGASLGLFGTPGFLAAPLVLGAWWLMSYTLRKNLQRQLADLSNPAKPTVLPSEGSRIGDACRRAHRTMSRAEILIVVAIIGILTALLIPAVQRSDCSGAASREHLARVGKALQLYHDDFGSLPPAYVRGKSGRPLHSWRVLILPQLGYETLYRRYRFDEPWDGPNNIKLLDERPSEYRTAAIGAQQRRLTALQVVVGPETAWPGSTPRCLPTITDNLSGTMLVVECENRPVPWTAPNDLTESDAIDVLLEPPRFPHGLWRNEFFTSENSGRLALTAGNQTWRGLPASPESLQELLRVNEGSPRVEGYSLPSWQPMRQTVVHYGNICRLVFFLIVVAWPARRLWIETRRARLEAQGAATAPASPRSP